MLHNDGQRIRKLTQEEDWTNRISGQDVVWLASMHSDILAEEIKIIGPGGTLESRRIVPQKYWSMETLYPVSRQAGRVGKCKVMEKRLAEVEK